MIDFLILLLAQGSPAVTPGAFDPANLPPAVRARAKANLASLVRVSDYPPRALARGEQGRVFFELIVGPDGRVASCRVTRSSGSSDLDTATCRVMGKRARFIPARDAEGRPVSDRVSSHLVWMQF